VGVRFIGGRAAVTEAGAGLAAGDVITAIDGVPVAELVKRWSPYYAASNEPTRLRDIAPSLMRGECGATKLSVLRGNETLEVTGTREPVWGAEARRTHDLPGDTFRVLPEKVAYLKLSSIKIADVPGYIDAAASTKGLIIDIRNYPSQFVVFALGSRLVDEPTEFVRFTMGDPANPGAFYWRGEPVSLKPTQPRYTGNVAILVDEATQSQAEYTAMALRAAPGAIVIGSTTAGADGNVSRIPLPGGLHSMISGIGVFYPDRRPTQRVGIVPDVVVTPTLEGIRAGKDEVLEEAVRRILKN
jgi:C-terminal processing protease CtpA/Prc